MNHRANGVRPSAKLSFGASAIVRAEAVRVIGQRDGATLVIRQSMGPRDVARYERHDFGPLAAWPGEPVPVEWDPAPKGYETTPSIDASVLVRLRRLSLAVPVVGVVVGYTFKQEGVVRPGGEDDAAYLGGPGRRVALLEVALPTTRKARIVLVHCRDLTPLANPEGD